MEITINNVQSMLIYFPWHVLPPLQIHSTSLLASCVFSFPILLLHYVTSLDWSKEGMKVSIMVKSREKKI